MTNNPMTAAHCEKLMTKDELLFRYYSAVRSLNYNDAAEIACDLYIPALRAMAGEVVKVLGILHDINQARHSDNARGIKGQFVPDHTDSAIDKAEKALTDSAPFAALARVGEVGK